MTVTPVSTGVTFVQEQAGHSLPKRYTLDATYRGESVMTLSASVVEDDHKLEIAIERSSEKLARHRWHWTLDEGNALKVSIRQYAKDVGRAYATIHKYAKGYEAWLIAPGDHSLSEHMELQGVSVEKAAIAEVIAQAEGVTVKTVTHRRRGTAGSLANVHDLAKERAERNQTNVVDEAKNIVTTNVAVRAAAKNRTTAAKAQHTSRWLEVEGLLARAKRLLTEALTIGHGVTFSTEEEALLRDSIANVRAVLDLWDIRVAGTPDIDWDAELADIVGD